MDPLAAARLGEPVVNPHSRSSSITVISTLSAEGLPLTVRRRLARRPTRFAVASRAGEIVTAMTSGFPVPIKASRACTAAAADHLSAGLHARAWGQVTSSYLFGGEGHVAEGPRKLVEYMACSHGINTCMHKHTHTHKGVMSVHKLENMCLPSTTWVT